MTAFCRFEILLPCRFNDGQPVPLNLLSETVAELEERFGAVTWETQTLRGHWRHEETTYLDELVRLFVDTDDTVENRRFFRELKPRLKVRFRQLDIWLTVHPIEVL